MADPAGNGQGEIGKPLRDILIDRGYIDAAQWAQAEQLGTGDPVQVLIDRGWLRHAQLARAQAARMGLEFRDLAAPPDPSLGDVLPPELRASGLCAVLEVHDDHVVVALADPTPALRDAVRAALRPRRVEFVVTTFERLPPPVDRDDPDSGPEPAAAAQSLADLTAAPTIVRLLQSIIDGGLAAGASDIYIADFREGGTGARGEARYRIDGTVISGVRFPRRHLTGLISRLKLLAGMDIALHQIPQSGDIRWPSPATPRYDLRVEVAPDIRGEHATIRIFGHVAQTSLDDLGFSAWIRDQLDRLCLLPYGLVLVCGPTGCGKSTTLSVLLRRIHERFPHKVIYTAEHPVEQDIPGALHTAVEDTHGGVGTPAVAGPRTQRTFALMLRSFLRSAPDVIMVGEIRDPETARVAVDAALTGHLVLSTLHTNTAPAAVPRLIHMGVEPHLLADTLQAVLSQRLLRRVCPVCAVTVPYDGADLVLAQRYGLPGTERRGRGVDEAGRPCEHCYGGYRGRLAVGELMVLTPKARAAITAGVTEHELRAITRTPTLSEDGITHVRAGHTTLAEVLAATYVPGNDEEGPEGR